MRPEYSRASERNYAFNKLTNLLAQIEERRTMLPHQARGKDEELSDLYSRADKVAVKLRNLSR